MITIFDLLKDITTSKKDIVSKNFEAEAMFQPYIIQRWLSMQSPQTAALLNHTVNRLWRACGSSKDWSKLFISVVPKGPASRIVYIKKLKKEKAANSEDKDIADVLARCLEISTREAKEYIANGSIDLKKLKQEFNI